MEQIITALQNLLTYQLNVGSDNHIELDYTSRLKDLTPVEGEVIRASDVAAIIAAYTPTDVQNVIELPSDAMVVSTEDQIPLISPNQAMLRRSVRKKIGDKAAFDASIIVLVDSHNTAIVLKNIHPAANSVGAAGRIIPNAVIATDYTAK